MKFAGDGGFGFKKAYKASASLCSVPRSFPPRATAARAVVPTATATAVPGGSDWDRGPCLLRSRLRRQPSLRRRLRPTTDGTLTYRLDGTLDFFNEMPSG